MSGKKVMTNQTKRIQRILAKDLEDGDALLFFPRLFLLEFTCSRGGSGGIQRGGQYISDARTSQPYLSCWKGVSYYDCCLVEYS